MTQIRVEVARLRQNADELDASARQLREFALQAYEVAGTAPEYNREFGPKVRGMGDEARAVLSTRAEQVEALSVNLRARADAFQQADEEWRNALDAMNRRGDYPLSQIWANQTADDPPWWLIELIIGMVPFGDSIDIIKQLYAQFFGGESDELVLLLASLGLALDLGWLDGFIPDPVDAANAGIALFKGLVKQIPEGPAREAIMVVVLGLSKDMGAAGRFFGAFFHIAKNTDIFTALGKNPRALAALFQAGPEAMELLAKNEDAALALLKHGDEAIALVKSTDALEAIARFGPEAAEKLVAYGDEGLALIADGGKPMANCLASTPDEMATLATRTREALSTADELAEVGLDSPRAAEMIETISRNSTHGSGDRVVLGEWKDPESWLDEGGGYVGEAIENGGIYYQTPPGTYDRLNTTGDALWQTNQQFLERQLEQGIQRIDFVSGDIVEWADLYRKRASGRELNFLLDNASDLGYIRVGDSWFNKDLLN